MLADSNASPSDPGFRLLAEAMPQIVWIAGPDGEVQYFNHHWHEFTGQSIPTSLGGGWAAVVHPDDLEPTKEVWANALSTGQPYEISYRLLRGADQQYRWFIGRALPHRDAGGRVINWIGSCTDIHDQKMAEENLRLAKEQSDRNGKAKDEFLSVLSHELRTPLSAILGWVQLLEMGVLDQAESKDAVITIRQQAKVQSQLIEDLLEVSRIINGKFHMRQEPVTLTAVLDRTIDIVAPTAADKKISLERKIWDESVQILGDPQRVGQLAWNLLTNAVKFTPAGGKIIVEIKPKNGIAELTVCDTGRGIDSQQLARLFEHFSQADSTATRAHGGLGLGLSIVRHIVRMHRGTITATSKGVDCGTEFIVTFPPLNTPSAAPTTAAAREVGPKSLAGMTLLVVDDEESARAVAEASLRRFGASVETAASAEVAIAMLRGGRVFDVLISDIGMPGTSGLDLIRQIRVAAVPLRLLPAIALTAFASVDDQSQALDAGFSAHVAKPIDAADLVRQILGVTGR